ncbi:DUF1134 domain-containing protein [Sandaracinobacteroides saxicola]|uniref:DUF1134 domain-containing protein n=1 Tax=Sandaracinobacteroides saxicola TaxID=2759707 RepID=A0A7G5IJM8_9SPHN|nr:EipA family protein [Sandaracinobacteroides saxicola]QMW23570.1 DUF1134 domain-containing protein [Sandaracinobacteroides saxicola]
MRPALLALLLASPALAQTAAPQPATPAPAAAPAAPAAGAAAVPSQPAGSAVYEKDDIIAAADGAFGKGAKGVGAVIEKIFIDLGKPNAYIVGREGSGAVGVGLRYGKGTLYSKVEGERTVHWTGPSLGFDVGGDASRTFTLVYHLDDTDDIFKRFPAVEGRAYLIGGISANYHQRGRIIVVPVRLGAGWRLGANVGYIRYTREGRILPF